MKKIIVTLLAMTILTGSALAATGGCAGVHNGKRIVFNGLILDPANKNTAEGFITISGRRVVDFEGEQLKINYLFQTFRARNNRGDFVEGRVTNLFRKKGVIKRLYVREFGIDYRNIPMQCWQN